MFKLFKYVGKFKKNAILTSLFVAIEVVFEVAIPLVMGYMVTYGIEAKNLKMVFLYIYVKKALHLFQFSLLIDFQL